MPCSIQESSIPHHNSNRNALSSARQTLSSPRWNRTNAQKATPKTYSTKSLCRKELLGGTENCCGKQRPELRTHLTPKKCPSQSTTDKAQRMALLALGRELTFLFIHSGRLSQWIRVSLAHLQVQSPMGDTSCKLETRLCTCQANALSFRSTAPKVLPRDHWSLCNKPVRPRCLFATTPLRSLKNMYKHEGLQPNNLGTASLGYKYGGRYHHRHCFHLLGLHREGTAKAVTLYEEYSSGRMYLVCHSKDQKYRWAQRPLIQGRLPWQD